MQVSEIMVVDPVTVSDGAVLSEAARLMDEHRIRHLPVVRDDALVGVLSERDLLEPAGRLVPTVGSEGALEAPIVRSVMRPKPVTVLPETSIARAAELLCEWGVGCLPVTRREVLVGFLTETDLLDAFIDSARYGALGSAKDPPIRDCMTVDPATAGAKTKLDEAVQRMQAGDFRHLPITDDSGRLVGMVSDRDLRRAAGSGLPGDTRLLEIAHRRLSTATAAEPLSRAAGRMARGRIGAQPVVDGQSRLVGMLTVTDVLEHVARVLA